MSTEKQMIGEFGEKLVVKYCKCPQCKRSKTLKRLPANFKCADIVCDFCGYTTQVKTSKVADVNKIPSTIAAGAWGVQKERMLSGIYTSLYIVLLQKDNLKNFTINYLPRDLQEDTMFVVRSPLSETAKRAGWQGFAFKFTTQQKELISRIYPIKI